MLGCVGVVTWRRIDEIQAEFKRLLEHVRNDAIEQRTETVKTGIGVNLDKPRLELSVYHEVQPKDLEVIHLLLRCNSLRNAPNSIQGHFFHFRDYIFPEVTFFIKRVQVRLELRIGDLVGWLVSTILGVLFLDGIIGQMYLWLKITNIESIGRGPYITLLVPISPHHSI